MSLPYLTSLRARFAKLFGDPLALLAFVLALVIGGGATFLALLISALWGLVFALVGIPLIFGLMSLVPRIGGALSLGGNVGAGITLATLILWT